MRVNILHTIIPALLLNFVCFLSGFCQLIPVDTALRTGKLSNGLTYYIRKNSSSIKQADFFLVQKVGSVLEEESQRGLAHFLEHMAFNGTKNFPGNSIISDLEKKGIRFGSNINAYTGYDETVYRLTDIPIHRKGILDTALLVLHDWSGFILNNEKDIDDERGVIQEEWRTRSTGYTRVQENQLLPVLFAGTAYADRVPIGKMEVVNNFKYQDLKDYYSKWYRTDLQCVVVVGDINVDQVEDKIKRLFADISIPLNPAIRPYVQLPENKEPLIAIASDNEIQNTSAVVYWRQEAIPIESRSSLDFFKRNLINSIITNMLNQRFAEMAKTNKKTWQIMSRMSSYSIASYIPSFTLNINVPDNDLNTALKYALVEIERMARFGFKKEEYDPEIKSFNLSSNESTYFDRKSRPNSEFTREYVDHFLKGGLLPDAKWKYQTTKEIIGGITTDTLNYYVRKYISDLNMGFEILYPKKGTLVQVGKQDILKILKEVREADLKPWIKKKHPNDFADLKAPLPGRVLLTQSNCPPYDYTKWTLSNGVVVWFKKTEYDESDLFIYGYKPGGLSLVGLKDLPSGVAYNQLLVSSRGFSGFLSSVFSYINSNEVAITGNGTVINPEMLFKNIYIRMMQYKSEPSVLKNWKAEKLQTISARNVNPKIVFGDTLAALMNNKHPRALLLTDSSVIENVDYRKVIGLHRRFFRDANGFTFVITGNLNTDSAKKFAELWLGGLPAHKENNAKVIDHGMYPAKGIIRKHLLQKMEVPQSTITIGYTGEIPFNVENVILMAYCQGVLRLKLMETIREQEGASYDVGAVGELFVRPTNRFIFQVNFDTTPDPVKKEKMIAIVYNEIKELYKHGPDSISVAKIKLNLLKDYKSDVNNLNARYWTSTISSFLVYGQDWFTGYDKALKAVTPEQIRAFAAKIFNQGNIIEAVMDPK